MQYKAVFIIFQVQIQKKKKFMNIFTTLKIQNFMLSYPRKNYFLKEVTLKTAFAVCRNQIAPTLGSAVSFLILAENGIQELSCTEKIPLFLKKNHVDLLVCNGIGNCMIDLLQSMKIQIIPGVSGTAEEIIETFRAGKLVPGEKYSCTDHGQSCGACPGTF